MHIRYPKRSTVNPLRRSVGFICRGDALAIDLLTARHEDEGKEQNDNDWPEDEEGQDLTDEGDDKSGCEHALLVPA